MLLNSHQNPGAEEIRVPKFRTISLIIAASLVLGACSESAPPADQATESAQTPTEESADAETAPAAAENPLLADWDTPFGIPPFSLIRDEHYEPAFDAGNIHVCMKKAFVVVLK